MEDRNCYYKQVLKDQKGFHDQQVKVGLMSELGVRELGPDYATLNKEDFRSKNNFCNEMWNFYKKGGRIILNGRELNSEEFSGAAELLAKGVLKREILTGEYIHDSEYKLIKNRLG